MMPGLINNLRPFPSASAASKAEAAPRCTFSRAAAFTDKLLIDEIPLLPTSTTVAMPSKAVRIFPVPISQAAAQPRLAPDKAVPPARGGGAALPERVSLNYSSSGSEHDPSSVCLVEMVNEFMENQADSGCCHRAPCTCRFGHCSGEKCSSSGRDGPKAGGGLHLPHTLQELVRCVDDTESRLQKLVMELVDELIARKGKADYGGAAAAPSHSFVKRIVMKQLREKGYNAALCKSRWDHACGVPAGDYEYIDVQIDDRKTERLIVDTEFHAQFEIARPTHEYSAIWQLLPSVFVGRADKLQQLINLMSEAIKQSLTQKGLHLPPWRKLSYMKAKWFSPYKRTSNDFILACSNREGNRTRAGIAIRGCGLDARCTNELEELYHDPGSRFLLKREGNTGWKRDEITVVSTEWEPPAVEPKPALSAEKPRKKVTGLASLLLQAGTSKKPQSSSTIIVEGKAALQLKAS